MPADKAVDGNKKGPSWIEGVEVDPLIGWCLTRTAKISLTRRGAA
jgi:amidase